MNRKVPILFGVITLVLVAVGTLWPAPGAPGPVMYVTGESSTAPLSDKTPEAAVLSVFDNVAQRRFHEAYNFIGNPNQVDEKQFTDDVAGTYGSLRTYSNLEKTDLKALRKTDTDAIIRTTTIWASAVGPVHDTRDLHVVKQATGWRVIWPPDNQPNPAPQVIPANYLRWDVIWRGAGDDWGAQNVEAPHVRLISMKAVPHGDEVAIVGEILNQDIVPAFVSVNATLIGQNGQPFAKEGSFDKINHVLLPKEVSPFRIDFPGVKISQIKSVRMQPDSSLVPASADPTIGVINQRLAVDARGRHVLEGELLDESGEVVNIPHVLATYYNNIGQVIWVSDGYVDKALLPQTPVAFAVGIPDDLAAQVHGYRVTVNQYSANRY